MELFFCWIMNWANILLFSWYFSFVWSWFAVPLGAPILTMWQIAGLHYVSTWFFGSSLFLEMRNVITQTFTLIVKDPDLVIFYHKHSGIIHQITYPIALTLYLFTTWIFHLFLLWVSS